MPVLEPLPDEQYDENLPDLATDPSMQGSMDFEADLGAMNGVGGSDDVPEEIIEDVQLQGPEVQPSATSLQNEGSYFDLSYINDFRAAYQQALDQTGDPAKAVEMVRPMAQSWTPAQRHVYERTEGYDSVDPKYAADLVQSWYKQQDQLKAPQSQLAQERVDGMKTEKLNARRDTMRTAQMMLEAADRIDGAINNGLVGPWKNVEQAFDGSGMPFSDPDEFSERKALEVQTKRSVIDALPAFKGPLSDSDRKFFTEMFPAINEPKGVWKDYSKQLREKFQPIAEGNFELPSAAQPQSSAQAAPAATRNTFVYDGATYERLPDGTARLIE
jgi:hypothetical protein